MMIDILVCDARDEIDDGWVDEKETIYFTHDWLHRTCYSKQFLWWEHSHKFYKIMPVLLSDHFTKETKIIKQ